MRSTTEAISELPSVSRSDGLPPGWTCAAIGDLTELSIEQAGPGGGTEFVYIDISSIDNQTKRIANPKILPRAQAPSRAKQRLKRGDVLVSMTRPNLNAVATVSVEMEGAIGSTGFYVMRAHGIEPAWLYFAVQSHAFIDAMARLVQGVLYPAVRPRDIRTYPVSVAPLREQRRIVEEIEKQFTRLEAAVAALKRVQANLKRYRASVLKAACEGRLVPTEAELARAEKRPYEAADRLLARTIEERRARWGADQLAKMQVAGKLPKDDKWKAKYKEPAPPDTSNLPPLPEGWAWATVEQVAQLVQYGSSAKTLEQATGVPVLRMGNITTCGGLDFSQLKYLPSGHGEFPELLLDSGDLLFNRTNSPELVGKSAVYRGTPSPCSFASYLIRVRTLDESVSDYLAYCLNSIIGHAWIKSVVSQQVGQANVNGTKLQAFQFPLPPLGELQRIVAEVERRLSVIDELEATVEADLKRAAGLRQAILKRAFEGKLVPQDPSDEPASVLLERIRAERRSAIQRSKS